MDEIMSDTDTAGLCNVLLEAMAAFEEAQRRYYPGIEPLLAERFAPLLESIRRERNGHDFPGAIPPDSDSGRRLDEAAVLCAGALQSSTEGDDLQQVFINFMKASRRMARAKETLFPLTGLIPSVNRFFLEKAIPDGAKPASSIPVSTPSGELIHLGAEAQPYARGACSFYVPGSESAPSGKLPLILALHGGFGHGRDFIWTWIREARNRRLVIAAPSSMGHTWSITGGDVDADLLDRVLKHAMDRWPIDPGRILLTGISDGATYALIQAMKSNAPFNAYAPVAGVLAPFDLRSVNGRRVFWVHGALDWMFPCERAKTGARMLAMAGADVTLHVIPDLYHAYPGEQNDAILNWFDPGLALNPERS
jgi:phospholipase/carboxylesterase